MKISLNSLKRYIDIQESDISRLVELLEDIGLEVKRQEATKDRDTTLTLELLANRGDHHSYIGIAREVSGRTGWTVKTPETSPIEFDSGATPTVAIETPSCFAYTLCRYTLKGGINPATEADHARMLDIAGVVSKEEVVNISNLIGIELGQPTHVFDADKVEGTVCVRPSRPGETATLLFRTDPITIPENTIVISDNKKVLAIAGVIGCESAKPDENTKNIFFESALYDPVAIRLAARAIGEQTHASMRFERGGDAAAVTAGAQRAKYLLEKAGWTFESAFEPRKSNQVATIIEINVSRLNRYLGTNMSGEDVKDAIGSYGFVAKPKGGKDNYEVSVPSYRFWDVKQPCDIYEEICRQKGYGSLPSEMPVSMPVGNSPAMAELKQKIQIEEQLIGQGFYEVFTDGFYGEAQRSKMRLLDKDKAQRHVSVINSEERAYSLLKNNTVAQFLDIVKVNNNMRTGNVKAYEWTRVFTPNDKAENGLCDERRVLWFGAVGEALAATWENESARQADVYFIKGLVERVFEVCDLQIHVQQTAPSDQSSLLPSEWMLHPARKARVIQDKNVIGVFGEVHPRLLYAWDLKSVCPVYAEIDTSFLGLQPTPTSYIPPSASLPLKRDICFLMPSNMNAGQVVQCIDEALAGCGEVVISNVFNSPESTEGRNAVTFSLTYDQGKVSAAKVNNVTESIVEHTLNKLEKDGLFRR